MAGSTALQRTIQSLSPWTRQRVHISTEAHGLAIGPTPAVLARQFVPRLQARLRFAERVLQRYAKPGVAPLVHASGQAPYAPSRPTALPLVAQTSTRPAPEMLLPETSPPVAPDAQPVALPLAEEFTTDTLIAPSEGIDLVESTAASHAPTTVAPGDVSRPTTALRTDRPAPTAAASSAQSFAADRPLPSLAALIDERIQRAQLGLPPTADESEEDAESVVETSVDHSDVALVRRDPESRPSSPAPIPAPSTRQAQVPTQTSLVAMIEERILRAQAGLPPIPPENEEQSVQVGTASESLAPSPPPAGEPDFTQPRMQESTPARPNQSTARRPLADQVEQSIHRAAAEWLASGGQGHTSASDPAPALRTKHPAPRSAQRLPPQVRRMLAYSSIEEYGSNQPEQPAPSLPIARPVMATPQAADAPSTAPMEPDEMGGDSLGAIKVSSSPPRPAQPPTEVASVEAVIGPTAQASALPIAEDTSAAQPPLASQPIDGEHEIARQPIEEPDPKTVPPVFQAVLQPSEQPEVSASPVAEPRGSQGQSPLLAEPEHTSTEAVPVQAMIQRTEETLSEPSLTDDGGTAVHATPDSLPHPAHEQTPIATESRTGMTQAGLAPATAGATAAQAAQSPQAVEAKTVEQEPLTERKSTNIPQQQAAAVSTPQAGVDVVQTALAQRSGAVQPPPLEAAEPSPQTVTMPDDSTRTRFAEETVSLDPRSALDEDEASVEPVRQPLQKTEHPAFSEAIAMRASTVHRASEGQREGSHPPLILARPRHLRDDGSIHPPQIVQRSEATAMGMTPLSSGETQDLAGNTQAWVQRIVNPAHTPRLQQMMQQTPAQSQPVSRALPLSSALDLLPSPVSSATRNRLPLPKNLPSAQDALPQVVDLALQPAAAGERSPAAQPDLDVLARQVLPLIKRMLVVERERGAHMRF